ncbi:MAG: hypothetical protein WBA51_16810 [Erythrobacter sp.]
MRAALGTAVALILALSPTPGLARGVPITKEHDLESEMSPADVAEIFGPPEWDVSLGASGNVEYRTYVAMPSDTGTKAILGLSRVMTLGLDDTYDDAMRRVMVVYYDPEGMMICADRYPIPAIGHVCKTDHRSRILDALQAGDTTQRRDYHRLVRRVDTTTFAPEVVAFDKAQEADEPIAYWNAGMASGKNASGRAFRQNRLCFVAAWRMVDAAFQAGDMGQHRFWVDAHEYFGTTTYFLAGARKLPFASIAPMLAEDRKTLAEALDNDYYDPASNVVDCQTTYARKARRVAKERNALLDRVP